jgi:hypothetical protein
MAPRPPHTERVIQQRQRINLLVAAPRRDLLRPEIGGTFCHPIKQTAHASEHVAYFLHRASEQLIKRLWPRRQGAFRFGSPDRAVFVDREGIALLGGESIPFSARIIMSDDQRRRGKASHYLSGNGNALMRAPSEPDDRLWTWTSAQLEKMDKRFVAQLERAFRRGRELRSSASNQQRPGAGDRDRFRLSQ